MLPCRISSALVFLLSLAVALLHPFNAQGQILDAHNKYRAKVGVGPLIWSEALAAYAERYNNQGAVECKPVPSQGPYGENLISSTLGYLTDYVAVGKWVEEKAYYNYSTNTCDSGKSCGHYTQVVWANTTHVGCARAQCDNYAASSVINCNYDPPGNIIGQRPYTIQQTPVANPPNSDSFAPSPDSNSQYPLEVDYLNAHNAARAKIGVGPMIWDTTLVTYAQDYANKRINDCIPIRSGGPYGENLASISSNFSDVDAVHQWVSEKAYYNNNSNTCAADKECRQYIQVIWRSSTNLGCARVRCNDGEISNHGRNFVVCNYYPGSNYTGDQGTTNQSITPAALEPSPSIPLKGKKINVGLVAGFSSGVGALILGLGLTWLILKRKKGRDKKLDNPAFDVYFGDRFENETGPKMFSHVEMAKATSNFLEAEKLGEGGFGAVYRGFLSDSNSYIAVKRVSRRSKQGIKEYTSEVKIISRLRHKNLVKLIGWCHEKELILAYEFMPNGSLDSHLFKGRSILIWEVRYRIVQGLASALLYLHEEGDQCVLHRDIKTSNIMLDSNFNAKLGDFGLARLVDHLKGSQTTVLAGTMGYMAPECVTSGRASKESDVFSFGVVVLEIACGRRSIEPKYDEAQASLVAWVWESYGNGRLLDVADKKLSVDFDMKQMEYFLIVGLWCAHPDHNLRPSIRQVIQVLNFETPLPDLPSKMPVAKYDVPTASAVCLSEPLLSSMTLTVPR